VSGYLSEIEGEYNGI